MSSYDRNYYVLCDDNCRFPSMTAEQIMAAIVEATGGAVPTHIDDAFITKIREQNKNNDLKFWVGTEAQYAALEEPEQGVFYVITDADPLSEIQSDIEALQSQITNLINSFDDFENRLQDAENAITEHGTQITSQGNRLTTAEGNITSQGTRLTTAEGKITSQGNRLTQAESDIVNIYDLFDKQDYQTANRGWKLIYVNGEVDLYYYGSLANVSCNSSVGSIYRSSRQSISYPNGVELSKVDFVSVSLGGIGNWVTGQNASGTSAGFYVNSPLQDTYTFDIYIHVHGTV